MWNTLVIGQVCFSRSIFFAHLKYLIGDFEHKLIFEFGEEPMRYYVTNNIF